MLIDWTTVIFQIINFLILIALLKRFLYGPIIKVMDDREKTIAGRLADAALAKQEAQGYAGRLAADQQDFADKRELLQQKAKQEIEKWKEESLERLKAEISARQKNWQQSLDQEQDAFLKKLKITISRQVFEVSRKVMTDLADNKLETRLLEVFLEKISRENFMNSQAPDQLTVISGFALEANEEEMLKNGLQKFFPGKENPVFLVEPELGFGLRLLAGDKKLEWNLSRYMDDVENEIIGTISRAK